MANSNSKFNRILLKISGEALAGDDRFGIDPDVLNRVAVEISSVAASGIEVAVVMGAGNFFRGRMGVEGGMDRVASDQMGMLATLMNALALRDAIARAGREAVVMSAIEVGPIAKLYSPHKGRKILEKGKICLCAAGTGNPFFTTDTAGVLRALELECGAMFKATKVDGVYSDDPVSNPKATRFSEITYSKVLELGLGVMDLTAVTLAEKENLPIVVFNLNTEGALGRVISWEFDLGTIIKPG
ncbi:MAG: UMP kinase [bacterium]|nr:UMP kinase [bacterium]